MKMYKVVCKTRAREIVVGEVSNLKEAREIAEMLNDATRSNPKSTAHFYVVEK